MIRLGVLSDTHVPDRSRRLDPQILARYKDLKVHAILHAGDVSSPVVLRDLEEVAPVYAARGNRDWFLLHSLPAVVQLTFYGVPVLLTHGHGSLLTYLRDRVYFMRHGYQLQRYQTRIASEYPDSRVIIFGHTHHALNQWVDGRLLFNPGCAHLPNEINDPPSIGFIQIHPEGTVKAELICLDH